MQSLERFLIIMRKTNILVAGAVALVAGLALRLEAGSVRQTITIEPGWSAVYVSVAPEGTADEVFASWPVDSVSAYSARAFRVTADSAGGLTGEDTVISPFAVWMRAEPHTSTLGRLMADTVLVCHGTNETAVAVEILGAPSAPRIVWHKSNERETYNYVGVRLAEGTASVKAADYFAGCPSVAGDGPYYVVCNTVDGDQSIIAAGGGFGRHQASAATISDGGVLLVPGTCVSDWSGPLHVSPRDGLDFGADGTVQTVEIRNDGAAAKYVTVSYRDSAGGETRPNLLYRESDSADVMGSWDGLTNTLMRVLSTGDTWSVAIALDRTKLAGSGAALGGVLHIEEGNPAMAGYTAFAADIGVSAVDAKPTVAWPQGLWCVQAKLDAVSWQSSDTKSVDDVAAGGIMPVKFYVHVDAEGRAWLVQRVTVAGSAASDGSVTETLYGPDATPPTGVAYSRRLSSAVLPVDMGMVEASSGSFGDASAALGFTYAIGPDSPSNPFHHALHPLFDNKRMDFETSAPDGDNATNYVGSVKPERFTIGGAVVLDFDAGGGTAWTPQERLAGRLTWIYTGVRRQGPVKATGDFTARRVMMNAEVVR